MHRCDAKYQKEVLLSCYEAFAQAGFSRFRKEGIDWPLGGGFHGWVGLNTGLYDEYVQINPFIGVHVVQIEKLWTSLEQRKYDRGDASFAIHMGEIAAKERAFRFTRTTNAAFHMQNPSLRMKHCCRFLNPELTGWVLTRSDSQAVSS
jgi:hypothetical protein